ncbi:MAG: hypothetical protein EOP04_19345, partial [Proteobacteria bacterium]
MKLNLAVASVTLLLSTLNVHAADSYTCVVDTSQIASGSVIRKNSILVEGAVMEVGQPAQLFPQTVVQDLAHAGARLYIGYGPGSYYGVSGDVINVTVDFLSNVLALDLGTKLARISATAPATGRLA